MRSEGIVKSWNDERAFGFIEPSQGGQEIFIHITAFPPRSGRPQLNQLVSFEVELNRDGKKRATKAQIVRVPQVVAKTRPRRGQTDWGAASLFAVPLFVALYLAVAMAWRVPNVVGIGYAVLSIACFVAYAADKSAARSGSWCTKEDTLLLIGLVGGWPGALLAQQFLRHKSVKASFRAAFWATVVINIVAFVALSSPKFVAWSAFR